MKCLHLKFLVISHNLSYQELTWNNIKRITLPVQYLLDNLQVIGIKPLNATYN